MKPIIDVHAHIFSAKDIPLRGYLLSRKSKTFMEKCLGPILIPSIAKCIRRREHPRRFICKLALTIVYAIMGKQYRKWADTLSKQVVDIASEMVDTFQKDGIDLYVPLMIDYEYWFENTPDHLIKCQIDHIYSKIILAPVYEGRIHPFGPSGRRFRLS